MRRTWRGLLVAAVLAGAAAVAPVTAEAGDGTYPYTCNETTTNVGAPELSAPIGITATDAPDPAKVFQPVTWTASLATPDLGAPLTITLHYLRVRLHVPDGVTVLSARAIAAPATTPNPALADIGVSVVGDEIVVQAPATPDSSHRILVASEAQGGALTYPFVENTINIGSPVVLPQIQVTGVAEPSAAGTSIDWRVPEIDVEAAIPVLGTAAITCAADGEPDPVLVSTAVSTGTQTCDGRAVTVQLGYNSPTGGADVIQGTAAADTANGGGGADRFCGLGGVDTYHGGAANDRALGGAGNDKLFGDAGDDRLQGDDGADNLQGGAGRDALIGGAQRDTCNGGTQSDTATTCEVRQSIP